MPTNLDLAREADPRPIAAVAADLGLAEDRVEPYGRYMAKVRLEALEGREGPGKPRGKLVLVSAMSPTPAGEGKTTLTVGLAQGLNRIGVRGVAALREPSIGPVFGIKGGGTGGGRSQLLPMDAINLHFTGDLHAISSANNLLSALIENHLHWGGEPDLDSRSITWKRCLDVNDRSLRGVVTGLGGRQGVPRETAFEITAASEVMAIFALAASTDDLRERLGRILVGADRSGRPVTADELGGTGAMTVLLRDALHPNLAQTTEGTPAFVHGGPFGNIAHGCSSVLGTRMALAYGEVCVTEAGFGADLGAEKFLNIKARQAGLGPDMAVLLGTLRSLKYQGGAALGELEKPDPAALERGFANIARHAENLRKFGLPVLAALNRFTTDTDEEIALFSRLCEGMGMAVAVADPWSSGGAGCEDLAHAVMATLETPAAYRPLYPDDISLHAKIEAVAREIYRADHVAYLPAAEKGLRWLETHGYDRLPVCIAKTQYSFSDDASALGAPAGHTLTVRDVKVSAGAGFVVVYAGTITTMPGLPRRPAAQAFDVLENGDITGVF